MPFPQDESYYITDSAELEDGWVLGLIWWFRTEYREVPIIQWAPASIPRSVGVMLANVELQWIAEVSSVPVQTQEEFDTAVGKYQKYMNQLVEAYQYGRQYIDETFPIKVWNTAAKAKQQERAGDVEKYVQHVLDYLHRNSTDVESELQHMTPTRVFEIVNSLDSTIQFNQSLMEATAKELKNYMARVEWSLHGEKPDREIYEQSQEMFQSLKYDDMTTDQLLDLRNQLSNTPQADEGKIRLVDEALRRRTSGFRPRLVKPPLLKKMASIYNDPLAGIEIRF